MILFSLYEKEKSSLCKEDLVKLSGEKAGQSNYN